MENASKALYMAAGILVSLMIVAIFVYLFRAGGMLGENYEERQSQEQLQLFNSKFENFVRQNNTISDMISVANLAFDNNEEYEYNSRQTVDVDIKFSSTDIISVSSKLPIEKNYFFISKASSVDDSTRNLIYAYDLMNSTKLNLVKCFKQNDGKITRTTNRAYVLNLALEKDYDTLSTVDNKMRYKYLFKCTDIQYHEASGRVKYMAFEITKNNDYISP